MRREWKRVAREARTIRDFWQEVHREFTIGDEKAAMEYIAYPHKDRKSDFGVTFPDFPGCVTAGKTLDEARRLTPQALALHMEGMMEDGETVPEASTTDELADGPALKEQWRFC